MAEAGGREGKGAVVKIKRDGNLVCHPLLVKYGGDRWGQTVQSANLVQSNLNFLLNFCLIAVFLLQFFEYNISVDVNL